MMLTWFLCLLVTSISPVVIRLLKSTFKEWLLKNTPNSIIPLLEAVQQHSSSEGPNPNMPTRAQHNLPDTRSWESILLLMSRLPLYNRLHLFPTSDRRNPPSGCFFQVLGGNHEKSNDYIPLSLDTGVDTGLAVLLSDVTVGWAMYPLWESAPG